MIPVDRGRLVEPAGFETMCRMPGNAWLAAHPDALRPRDYWSGFKSQLADGFGGLCAYSAMSLPVGTVDHFVSFNEDRGLAYEWSNFRYAAGWINSSKKSVRAEEILDPLLVDSGWFQILLPSLQLVATNRIPVGMRGKAEDTLRRLHLTDDERIVRQRLAWFKLWDDGELTIDGLRRMAPLIAEAITSSGRLPSTSRGGP